MAARKKATKGANGDAGWVSVKPSTSSNRRKRRKKAKNKSDGSPLKAPVSTRPRHAAPPNASTIYCQWYQEGICERGNKCFFIHDVDPLSGKNPVAHKAKINRLLAARATSPSSQPVKVALSKPIKPQMIRSPRQRKRQQQMQRSQHPQRARAARAVPSSLIDDSVDDLGLLLPSQNPAVQAQLRQQAIERSRNQAQQQQPYDRYSHFNPHAYPPNMLAESPSPPNPVSALPDHIQAQLNGLNVTANEFVPIANNTNTGSMYHNNQPLVDPQSMRFMQQQQALAAQNMLYSHTNAAPNVNPFAIGRHIQPVQQVAANINIDPALLADPSSINEDDYEVWEDENGEIIVVPKSQLYPDEDASSGLTHDQRMAQQYNQNQTSNVSHNQRGIRDGGQTYAYGASPRRKRKRKKGKYANIVSGKPEVAKKKEVKKDVCHYWLTSQCLYGANCRNAHSFDKGVCPHCQQSVPGQAWKQQEHLSSCGAKRRLDREMKASEAQECGICRENVVAKGRKFGLLTGCNHCFCYKCIREWRGSLHQTKEVVRSCPICRTLTYLIVPSMQFVTNERRKQQLVEEYKKRQSEVRCKHFDDNEECPFGTSCFYKHVRKDGSVDDKSTLKLRHLIDADGQTQILKDVMLSDCLFGPERR